MHTDCYGITFMFYIFKCDFFQITLKNLNPGVWYEFYVQSVGEKDRVNREESNIVRQQTGMDF